jgi:tRNA-2-methylthio-N6-dimethylallyladenosine synthase
MQRFKRLLILQEEIANRERKSMIGRLAEVLVEGPSKSDADKLTGRNRGNRLIHFSGSADLIGELIQLRITAAGKNSFQGEVINPDIIVNR